MGETAMPSQGQSINQQFTIPNPAEHMNKLSGELNTESVNAGWDQRAKGSGVNEDTVYAFSDNITGSSIFAVFDGMGGHAAGEVAATAARNELHELAGNGELRSANSVDGLIYAFDEMNKMVSKEAPYGGTTGLVTQLSHESGGTFLSFAAVGDSLGFIVRRDGTVSQLNREESLRQEMIDGGAGEAFADAKGNVITNALKGGDGYQGVSQKGTVMVNEGDFIVLTSDGITGDNAGQRMRGGNNEAAIRDIVLSPHMTPNQKAQALIDAATKNDDRTALVVEVMANPKAKAEFLAPETVMQEAKSEGWLKKRRQKNEVRRAADINAALTNLEAAQKESIPTFVPGQEIIVERNNPDGQDRILQRGWKVYETNTDEEGQPQVIVVGDIVNPHTGKLEYLQKAIHPSDLAALQDDYKKGTAGKDFISKGPGIIVDLSPPADKKKK